MSRTVRPVGPVTKAQWSLNTIPKAGPVVTFPRYSTFDEIASGMPGSAVPGAAPKAIAPATKIARDASRTALRLLTGDAAIPGRPYPNAQRVRSLSSGYREEQNLKRRCSHSHAQADAGREAEHQERPASGAEEAHDLSPTEGCSPGPGTPGRRGTQAWGRAGPRPRGSDPSAALRAREEAGHPGPVPDGEVGPDHGPPAVPLEPGIERSASGDGEAVDLGSHEPGQLLAVSS